MALQTLEEIDELGDLLCEHGPPLVFTFGAFAFEFAKRSLSKGPKRSPTLLDD